MATAAAADAVAQLVLHTTNIQLTTCDDKFMFNSNPCPSHQYCGHQSAVMLYILFMIRDKDNNGQPSKSSPMWYQSTTVLIIESM